MGVRRSVLAAVAVGTLGLLGTACEPTGTPQMELTMDISPSGRYEVLSKTLWVDVTVSCTRATTVHLAASTPVPFGDAPLYSYDQGTTVACPGPGGQTFTTRWIWGASAPTSVGFKMTGKTYYYDWAYNYYDTLPVDRDDAYDAESVTFTRILCWFGFSNPCGPA
jgi:hypothetical protein